jgi:large subunit ribosomal protein L25
MNELEITCLPKHLPEYIEVDVSDLELEGARALGEVKLPEGVSIYGGEEMLEQPVLIIHRPRREEEEETEGEAPEEGEVPTVGDEAKPEED